MKCKLIAAGLCLTALAAITYHGYDLYDDIQVAKVMTITYLNKTRKVDDGLNQLAGNTGKIKWTTAKVVSSNNSDLVYSTAIVLCQDKTGKHRTCVFHFRINHDTNETGLDDFFIDDIRADLKEGLKLIVSGEFG